MSNIKDINKKFSLKVRTQTLFYTNFAHDLIFHPI